MIDEVLRQIVLGCFHLVPLVVPVCLSVVHFLQCLVSGVLFGVVMVPVGQAALVDLYWVGNRSLLQCAMSPLEGCQHLPRLDQYYYCD